MVGGLGDDNHPDLETLDRLDALERRPDVTLDPPPTPEEVNQAEMYPWGGHTLAETIQKNREFVDPAGDQPQPEAPA